MKVYAVAFSLIIASSVSAQKGVARQTLRYRLLKAEKEQGKQGKDDEPIADEEPVPLSSATSMSMSAPYALADPAFPEWDAELTQFAFDTSVSLSMSMAAVKCDKKCQKEQAKAEEVASVVEPEFSEWGAAALTEFEFDVSLSQSMSMTTEKCDKKCQKEKLGRRHRRMEGKADKETAEPEDEDIEPLSASSSLSLSIAFGAWAEPDLELFGFEAFGSSMSMSMLTEKCDKKCQKEKLGRRHRRMEGKAGKETAEPEDDDIEPLSAISSLSLSIAFGAWAEPDLELFGFEAFESSLSFSLPEGRGFVLSERKRGAIATDSSLSLSVDFEAWTESELVDFGFDTFDASMSLSMSTP
ncbi:hypothetical protein ACHAW6_010866 [Cyclotella cf. meneghiniana]